MIEKPDDVGARFIAPATPATPGAKEATLSQSLLPPVLCTIAYIFCVLLMAAPLSRILDPVIRLQLPFGAQLAKVGAWLPINLGLNANLVASQTTTSMIEVLGLIALSFVVYGLCALSITRLPAECKLLRHTLVLLWAGALLAGLIFVFTPAMLSHDILVYTGYSRLMANYHANPYFVPLSAFPHDPYVPLNYWASSVAAYGPIWLEVCWIIGLLVGPQAAGYVLAFRLFALAVHLLNIWLVMRTLRALGASQRTITLGALLYAWNPLVLLESSLGGHNDVFMLSFILLGAYLTARAQQHNTFTSPRGYLPPLIAFTLSALVKFTSLPVIALFIIFLAWNILRGNAPANSPARAQRGALSRYPHLHPEAAINARDVYRWKVAILTILMAGAAAGVLAIALYAPFWIGHSISDIRASFTSPPSSRGAENSILRSILAWTHDHNLPANTLESRLISIFSIRQVWDAINIVLLALACILSAVWLWRSPTARTFTLAALAALGVLLIVTPWFFSWYVTWLVGLAAVALPVRESRAGRALLAFALTFSASAFSTYLFLYGYPPFGIWTGWVCLTTITPPLLAFLIAFLAWQPAGTLHLSGSENVQS